MMRIQSYRGLLAAALLLVMASGVGAQEFRATVRGQVVDSSKAALPGATVTCPQPGNRRSGHRHDEQRRQLHRPLPSSRSVHADRRAERLPEAHPQRTCASQVEPDRRHQRAARRRRRDREGHVSRPNHRFSRRATPIRGTVIDSARIAELPLQSRSPMALAVLVAGVNYNAQAVYLRPFDNGALAAWSMNGGREQQQRVPARRRAEQRQPGRQQHRLRAAGGSGAGDEDFHELVRRAVRPHRRRRRQHVAQVGHQLVPRRRLRLHAPQGAWPPTRSCSTRATARRPTSTSISTGSASMARSGRTRPSSCSPARSTAKARPRRCSAPCRPRRSGTVISAISWTPRAT